MLLLVLAAVPASAGDKKVAAVHFQRGRALYEAGRFTDALDEFQAGYEAFPLAAFLVNIGQCQRKLERLDEAAHSFQSYLDTTPSSQKLRAEVEEALAEVTQERQRHAEEAARQRRLAEEPPRSPRASEEARSVAAADAAARPSLAVSAAPAASEPALAAAGPPAVVAHARPARKSSQRWVWAVVGSVLAAGAAAAAVSVAVIELQPPAPHAGSLGLLDGRR
jgi:tetratricopeptide (TPR) repeat protein